MAQLCCNVIIGSKGNYTSLNLHIMIKKDLESFKISSVHSSSLFSFPALSMPSVFIICFGYELLYRDPREKIYLFQTFPHNELYCGRPTQWGKWTGTATPGAERGSKQKQADPSSSSGSFWPEPGSLWLENVQVHLVTSELEVQK